jgi:hypothetical protein
MAVDHKIIRASEEFKGLDKRSSDIARTIQYATDIRNAAFRVSGAINKRKGFEYKYRSSVSRLRGLCNFAKVDPASGVITEELLQASYDGQGNVALSKFVDTLGLTITTTKLSTHNIFYSLILDETTSTYKFILTEVDIITGIETEALNYDLGTGVEENPIDRVQIISLSFIINNVTGYSCTYNTAVQARAVAVFFGVIPTTQITTASTELTGTYIEVINSSGSPAVGVAAYTHLSDIITNEENAENYSFAELNNVLYFTNGSSPLIKYDGESHYLAGLPIFEEDVDSSAYFDSQNVYTDTSGVNFDHGNYSYKLVFEYTDAVGNVITSQPSNPTQININSSTHIHVNFKEFVTYTNSSYMLRGYDLDGTFDSNHPLYDSLNTGTRPDSEPIGKWQGEKRLRVLIYRAYIDSNDPADIVPADAIYSLVGDVPYDYDVTGYSNATEAGEFPDHNTDTETNLFLALPNPVKRHDPPPKGKYLSVYKNCLVISGQKTNVNNIQYSLPKNAATGEIGSEYFPRDDNGLIVQSSFGDKITAIATLRDLLYVFHKNSIHVMSGNINELEIPTTDLITKEGAVGCQSYHSIQEFNNSLIFLSQNGIYAIDSSNALSELSSLIKPLFLDNELKRQRAVSFNWTEKNMLLFMIPKEEISYSSSGQEVYIDTLSTSLVLAYDYFKQAWLQWDSIDFSGGIVQHKNDIYFYNRNETDGNTVLNYLTKFLNNGDKYDYRDHNLPISFNYDTNWESLGEPTIPKKYLRLKIHSFDTDQTFESPEGFDLSVKIQKNYVATDLGNINFDFASRSGGGWGNFLWGSGTWGSIGTDSLKSKLPTGKSKCMKLRFTNEHINENVLITTYELEIAAPFLTEIKE